MVAVVVMKMDDDDNTNGTVGNDDDCIYKNTSSNKIKYSAINRILPLSNYNYCPEQLEFSATNSLKSQQISSFTTNAITVTIISLILTLLIFSNYEDT